MATVTIDKDILGLHLDFFISHLVSHQNGMKQKTRQGGLSGEFAARARAAEKCAEDCLSRIRPIDGYSAVDILNGAGSTFLRAHPHLLNFGKDADELRETKFVDAACIHYEHGSAREFLDRIDHSKKARQALHDYVDAQTLFYAAMHRNRLGPVVEEEAGKLADIMHKIAARSEILATDRKPPDNVVTLFPRKK